MRVTKNLVTIIYLIITDYYNHLAWMKRPNDTRVHWPLNRSSSLITDIEIALPVSLNKYA